MFPHFYNILLFLFIFDDDKFIFFRKTNGVSKYTWKCTLCNEWSIFSFFFIYKINTNRYFLIIYSKGLPNYFRQNSLLCLIQLFRENIKYYHFKEISYIYHPLKSYCNKNQRWQIVRKQDCNHKFAVVPSVK